MNSKHYKSDAFQVTIQLLVVTAREINMRTQAVYAKRLNSVIFQNLDPLHTLLVFSYICLLSSPQAFQWRLETHHFCDACSSSTISADKLFLERNMSATICS